MKKNIVLRYILIILSLSIMFVLPLLPFMQNLSIGASAIKVLCVFLGTLILWLTVSIDWPSILCIFALSLIPELGGFKSVFSTIFNDGTIMFLIATFVCTYAISKTPFIKRIAIWFISSKFAKRGPWSFIISFFLATIVIGCFISPTVLFSIMLPILIEILNIAKIEKSEKVGAIMMMGMAFTVSISSGMTPISHVFCIMACDIIGGLNFAKYMLMAIPVGLILTFLMILCFKYIAKPDVSKLKDIDITSLKKDIPKISLQEIYSLAIFAVVIFLWVVPSIIKGTDNHILTMTILYSILAFVAMMSFNGSMQKLLNIKSEKSTLANGIFSIYSLLLFVGFVIVTYLDKMAFSMAILILMLLFVLITLVIILIRNKVVYYDKIKLPKTSIITLVICVLLSFLLVLFEDFVSAEKIYLFLNKINNYTIAMPAMLGAIILCILTVNKKPLVSLPDAFKNGIPWASIIMCCGTIMLGSALTNDAIGIKAFLNTNLTDILADVQPLLLIVIFTLWALLQTNVSSNMVTAKLVSTVAFSILSVMSGVSMAAVVYLIGMLASFAFATPPSMPHIALAIGSEYTTTKQVLGYGFLLAFISLILSVGIGYPILLALGV